MPPGFHWLIAAQFLSALADNALLIVTIALLQEQGLAGWWAPLLKFAVTLAYVLLAPGVGPLADAVPKGRLMAVMNAVKTLGLLALCLQLHPVLAFAVVGLGAAGYAPAKYGLIPELVGPARLVAANSWIEVSVVCAVLLGTVLGGALVSDAVRLSSVALAAQAGAVSIGLPLGSNLLLSLGVLLAVYLVSGLLQFGVPDSQVRYARTSSHPRAMLCDFVDSNRLLWRDRDGGLSLAVTTLFWGVGATLQFTVLGWAHDSLGLTLGQAAYMQGVVALGVVVGASVAGRFVPLCHAKRVLPAGVLLGLLIAAVAMTDSLWQALPLLVLVGLVGGVLVVPMNALLQHRGHQLLTAGRSIAVQGYNENLSILVMLAMYSGLLALQAPIVPLMTGFGLVIAATMALLLLLNRGVMRIQSI
jgi:MFS family permease